MEDATIGTVAPTSEISSSSPAATETPTATETEIQETPAEGSEETPTEEAPPEESASPEESSEEDLSADPTDGRRTDDATRKQIAELKRTNPEVGKKWAEDHFRRLEFEKVYPGGVREARQSKAAWDAIGGQEGVQKLHDDLGIFQKADEQYASGDMEFTENLNDLNPEALDMNLSNGLQVISKDAKRFDQVIMPHFVSKLEAAGMPQVVENLKKLVENGDGEQAYELLNKMDTWLKNLQSQSAKISEGRAKPKDPREEKIAARERALDERDKNTARQQATSEVNKLNYVVNSRITKNLFKDLKLSPEAQRRVLGLLDSDIWDTMAKDKTYLATAKALFGSDKTKYVQFVHDKYASLVPDKFRKLRNEFYPNYKPAPTVAVKPTANGKTNGAPAPKPVANKTYTRAEVDIENTPHINLIAGKAFLKGTKTLVPYQS